MAPAALSNILWVAALLAAGCLTPSDGPPPTSSPNDGPRDTCSDIEEPTFNTAEGLDGQNALGHVLNIICDFSQDPPREMTRVPGTSGRDAAARYLHAGLEAHGWDVAFQNFTGADYDELDEGAVAGYGNPPFCDAARRDRMLALDFANVLATRGDGAASVILIAHYDSKLNASKDPDRANHSRAVVGANDGASGVGLLVEVARVLPEPDPGLQWRILLDDGEDGFEDCHPLAGALYYAHSLSEADRDGIRAVILLDMVGDPDAAFCYDSNSAPLRQRVADAAQRQGSDKLATAPTCAGVVDDHTPFVDLGVEAIDIIDARRPGTHFPPYWHTTRDTADKISAATLGEVGRVVVDAVSSFNA